MNLRYDRWNNILAIASDDDYTDLQIGRRTANLRWTGPTKARFPLPELTGRVDGPSTRVVETRLNCYVTCYNWTHSCRLPAARGCRNWSRLWVRLSVVIVMCHALFSRAGQLAVDARHAIVCVVYWRELLIGLSTTKMCTQQTIRLLQLEMLFRKCFSFVPCTSLHKSIAPSCWRR